MIGYGKASLPSPDYGRLSQLAERVEKTVLTGEKAHNGPITEKGIKKISRKSREKLVPKAGLEPARA